MEQAETKSVVPLERQPRGSDKPGTDGTDLQAKVDMSPFLALPAAWLKWNEDLLKANKLPLSGNVDQWIKTWGEVVSQIGLVNVNVAGSGNPQLEKTITTEYSYGRQLGRMLDMLAPLVGANKELLEDKAGPKAVEDFEKMVGEIQKLKRRSVSDIVDEVKGWSTSSTFPEDLAKLLQQLEQLEQLAALSPATK